MSAKMQRRDRYTTQSLGLPLTKRIKEGRVLLVGAGGIGCEVLKNLVCCGFGSGLNAKSQSAQNGVILAEERGAEEQAARKPEIVVIDLDTIDLSNLNRQFLFRKQHIKKPKAYVAKETASQFNPSVNIDAHHASIFDSQYDVDFFEGFDVVFNALDNLAARRHVNRVCLAANVPLIESGTTGFNGQVQAIKKGVTECYDCNPKPVQKSFPICTIRSTPSQPIHCIVWAKSYLFPELFGTSEEDSADVAVTEGDNAEEVAKLREEAQALKKIRSMMGTGKFRQAVFDKVFHQDIERLRSMTEMWQSRKPPEPMIYSALDEDDIGGDIVRMGEIVALDDQRQWDVVDSMKVFLYSLDTLSDRAQHGEPVIEFDKDDKDTLHFVASAANLRAHIFGLPMHSEWQIKQMAGNIIPAIATSNALTASLCVMQAFKILRAAPISQQAGNEYAKPSANNNLPSTNSGNMNTRGKDEGPLGGSKMVFLNSKSTERMITAQPLSQPNPSCPVCSPVYAKLELVKDVASTLQDLVDLLKERIEYEDFSITTDAGVIYDPDLDDLLAKPLSEQGITAESNGFITVSDDGDDAKVDLVLSTKLSDTPATEGEQSALRLSPAHIALPLKPRRKLEVNGASESNGDAEPEPVLIAAATAGEKRKRNADEEVESPKSKKVKATEDAYVVEDDGAILLDD